MSATAPLKSTDAVNHKPVRSGPGKPNQKRPVHELFPGHSGTKVQCESCLFSQGKTPEFTKMSEIHELFVLAISLVWFARATPEPGELTHGNPGWEPSRERSREDAQQNRLKRARG